MNNIRIKWDPQKSMFVKANRGTPFEEAKGILFNELGGGLKTDDPEQHYSVGFASNGNLTTIIYEFRLDEMGLHVWLVTLWNTTKQEKRRIGL